MADGFLRHATEPNAVLGAYADGRAIEARPSDATLAAGGHAQRLFGGGMTTRSIALSAIRVGKRHRTDLGDIRSLARSIQEIGSGLKPRPGHLQENLAPHVVQNDSITATGKRRQSAIDGRTTRHKGYGLSQSCRCDDRMHLWLGQTARHDAQNKTSRHNQGTDFMLNLIAYNLIRIPKLLTA